jgi:hypothetical protein
MTHPGHRLTDYVDGTLDDDTRAEIDAHVRSCPTCTEEVRAARLGKRAAGSLPSPAVPAGLADAALAEASRVSAKRHPEVAAVPAGERRRPAAPRWATLAAAAAAVVAIALVVPKLGSGSDGTVQQAAAGSTPGSEVPVAGPDPADFRAAKRVEFQQTDYTPERLSEATRSTQQSLVGYAGSSGRSSGAELAAPAAQDATATSGAFALWDGTVDTTLTLDQATSCLQQAFRSSEGKLVRVVRATYDGEAAYFGVYLVAPGPDVSLGELRIDVAAIDGCTILAQSSAKI